MIFAYQALRPAQENGRRHQTAPGPHPLPTGDPRVTAEIPLGSRYLSGGIAAADGFVWVGAQAEGGSSDQVIRIDQATNEVVARIDVPATPWREKIAASASGVWIASGAALQRIDPVTNEVTTVARLTDKTITALAADDRSVWAVVVGDSGSLNDVNAWVMHIDLSDGQRTTQIPLLSRAVGYDDEIRLSAGSVWVSGVELLNDDTERGGPLVRIDPETDEVLSTWELNAFDFAVAGDEVLVRTPRDGLNDSPHNPEQWQLVRYDIDTGARLGEPSDVDNDADLNGSLAADQELMWGVGYDDAENVRVVRSDVATLTVDARSEPIPTYFHDAAIDPVSGTVWISAIRTIVRVDISGPASPSATTSAENPAIAVPDLIGQRSNQALQALDSVGLKWIVALREVSGAEPGLVASTDPTAGTSVEAGSTIRVVVASRITALPDQAIASLACGGAGPVAFGGPRLVLLPSGETFIRANVPGIKRTDKVVRATERDVDEGLWNVVRDGGIVAVVDYATLDGAACLGSGIAGT